ncbi:PEPxxWA-CTERM sorting domain-containing protein [Sphingomonas turrisvirgatae]|uniref:Ice-binding protein C-terminal domain-containing protein n=1 Tax=Sphingomonas turrisvirgatae TaxID=1888892 RepID=A0A1E3LRY4_9SPHN|nr:PEPxxWA-CTERM sorting domain-containing protein [Sphingomonas turrisvirgatae]ODP36499.1 hypothetical protein BFL28_05795 [Sphingomonas turrisvirgatae]
MAASASEHRLQMRILFVLSLLGALVALAFSQTAGLFNPPSIIAAGAQTPEELASITPGSAQGGAGGFVPGTRRPFAGNRNITPRTPGVQQPGAQQPGAIDDGLGGPVETADATGAVPPSIATDLGTVPAGFAPGTSAPGGGSTDFGPGAGLPGGGPAGAPGASANPPTNPNDPGTGNPGTGDPGTGNPGTGTPGDPGTPTNPGTPTTPVPEPATWLIMIVGIAIIGGALRRRKPVTVDGSLAHA